MPNGAPRRLTRYSDGFRTLVPSRDPRHPFEGEKTPDGRLTPPTRSTRPSDDAPAKNVPRNFRFFRPATLGAARVGFPDQRRTQGRLQHSGEAFTHIPARLAALPLAPPQG